MWLLEHPLATEHSDEKNTSKTEATEFALIGRMETLLELESLQEDQKTIMLSGLSGIGKTSVAQALIHRATGNGTSVHSAVVNEFSDLRDIVNQWLPEIDPLPYDVKALTALLAPSSSKRLFVLDDVHLVSPRHAPDITSMLKELDSDVLQFSQGFLTKSFNIQRKP